MEPFVISTGQHRTMLEQALAAFDLHPDADLRVMTPGQTLHDVTSRTLHGLRELLARAAAGLAGGPGRHHHRLRRRAGGLLRPHPGGPRRGRAALGAALLPVPRGDQPPHGRPAVAAAVRPDRGLAPAAAGRGLRPPAGGGHRQHRGRRPADGPARRARPADRRARAAARGAGRPAHAAGHRPPARELRPEAWRRSSGRCAGWPTTSTDICVVYPVHLNPEVDGPARELLGGHPRIHLHPPAGLPGVRRRAWSGPTWCSPTRAGCRRRCPPCASRCW